MAPASNCASSMPEMLSEPRPVSSVSLSVTAPRRFCAMMRSVPPLPVMVSSPRSIGMISSLLLPTMPSFPSPPSIRNARLAADVSIESLPASPCKNTLVSVGKLESSPDAVMVSSPPPPRTASEPVGLVKRNSLVPKVSFDLPFAATPSSDRTTVSAVPPN